MHHEHDGHRCGCGHDHDHGHHHHEGCGCAHEHPHHHGRHDGALTPAMEDFLHLLSHHKYLPVARFLVESSKEEDFCSVALAPVFLRSPNEDLASVKMTASLLLDLEEMSYLTLDYDYPLDNYSYEEYKESELFAYFCRTVEEASHREGFLGDTPVLELGSIALVEK